jgi:Flp pilus assembly protein TadG
MGLGDFIKRIAPGVGTAIGGAFGGPGGAAVGGGLGSALSGALSGGGVSPSDLQGQQEDMLDKLLGYETPGSKFLEDYTLNVFMDADDNYKKSKRAQNAFDVISDAVQSEDIDPFTGMQFMAGKLQPNSQFYGTKDFAKLLGAEVGNKKQNRLVHDAFATNFYRDPTKKEQKYYKNLASSLGQDKSPMQFSSFLNSRLANTLEAERKGPLNAREQMAQAYYGTAIRDAEGNKTGTYNVYGRPYYRTESSQILA